MGALNDLHILSAKIRSDMNALAGTRRAISMDNAKDFTVTNGSDAEKLHKKIEVTPRANLNLPFPKLKSFEKLNATEMAKLRGVVDLDKVCVVTGFAEVGPFVSFGVPVLLSKLRSNARAPLVPAGRWRPVAISLSKAFLNLHG